MLGPAPTHREAPWVGLLPTMGWGLGDLFALWDWGLPSCRNSLKRGWQNPPSAVLRPAARASEPAAGLTHHEPWGLSTPLYPGSQRKRSEIDQKTDAKPQHSSANLRVSDEKMRLREVTRLARSCPASEFKGPASDPGLPKLRLSPF